MTEAERYLWTKLRMGQLKGWYFYRQKPIGEYIVDFYCPKAKLVVEVDGGQHFSEDGVEYDGVRDEYLQGAGLKVLRFSNSDVMKNINGVVESILENMEISEKIPIEKIPLNPPSVSGKIPLNPPFSKGETSKSPFIKGRYRGISEGR